MSNSPPNRPMSNCMLVCGMSTHVAGVAPGCNMLRALHMSITAAESTVC